MDGIDYNLHNLLTNLASRVGEMEGQLKAFREQWRDQDTAAGLSRRVTHESLQLLTLQVERLANDILHIQQDLAEFKNDVDTDVMPIIQTSLFANQRKAGYRAAVAGMWAGLVVVISALAYLADRAVAYLTHKP